MAAACNGFHGLLFLPNRRLSFLIGLFLLVAAFAWFFLSAPRNVPDTGHGLNGNQQFGYFFAGLGAALALTLLASSLRNLSLGADLEEPPPGIDALRQSNYLRALYRTLSRDVRTYARPWRSRWKRSWKRS
jgi:hypothetical protein